MPAVITGEKTGNIRVDSYRDLLCARKVQKCSLPAGMARIRAIRGRLASRDAPLLSRAKERPVTALTTAEADSGKGEEVLPVWHSSSEELDWQKAARQSGVSNL